jgi:hypothetical protein
VLTSIARLDAARVELFTPDGESCQSEGTRDRGLSFRGVLPAVKGRERLLSQGEIKRLFAASPTWLRRVCEASLETALSEGDLIRLTDDMVDEENGVIVPAGGRCKTEVTQVAPLTERFGEILNEMRQERKRSKVKNIGGLVFTREDRRPIDKDMITGALKRARVQEGHDQGLSIPRLPALCKNGMGAPGRWGGSSDACRWTCQPADASTLHPFAARRRCKSIRDFATWLQHRFSRRRHRLVSI